MSEISDKVLTVSVEYLGPAARQFLDRQCRAHLEIEFDELSIEDLPVLARWISISARIIIDRQQADELTHEVLSIAQIYELQESA